MHPVWCVGEKHDGGAGGDKQGREGADEDQHICRTHVEMSSVNVISGHQGSSSVEIWKLEKVKQLRQNYVVSVM